MSVTLPRQKITPFLWFNTQAEEAARFYVSVFPNARITAITHYSDAGPLPTGTVMTVAFELDHQTFTALNGGPEFKFNEAVSFVVNCDSQTEIDEYWARLLTGGGHPIECGWLKDRFGLAWQVVPSILHQLLTSPNSGEVMKSLMRMQKLDLATLQAAAKDR